MPYLLLPVTHCNWLQLDTQTYWAVSHAFLSSVPCGAWEGLRRN